MVMFSAVTGLPSACSLRFKRLYSLRVSATPSGISRGLENPSPSPLAPVIFLIRASGGSSEGDTFPVAFSDTAALCARIISFAFCTPDVTLAAKGIESNSFSLGISDAGSLDSFTCSLVIGGITISGGKPGIDLRDSDNAAISSTGASYFSSGTGSGGTISSSITSSGCVSSGSVVGSITGSSISISSTSGSVISRSKL